MAQRLVFPDAYAAADLITFAGRAARAGDGAVHLRASGGTLVTAAAPLLRQGLLDSTPTIIGMRLLPVDPELDCDLVVEAALLQIAHDDAEAVELPETAVPPPLWSAAEVPRSGWSHAGTLDLAVLAERAQWGMSAVAHALPIDPGDLIVQAVRGKIWSAPDEDLGGLPRGVAFVARTLGFIGEDAEDVGVRTCGRWTRLTLRRGHVLLRGPAHLGMTEVRETGHVAALVD
ncbi:hypothetical protein GCM10022240_23100 [Microbacterium kribbense]|uniref:Uncharacterized protein n=1 Tax=Microbacterium kribbense TaxID=433645 RepID=A0ABP7GPI1_9MICO